MRPRLKAAENALVPDADVAGDPAASMRPRLKAAENECGGAEGGDGLLPASMRPRLKAAENREASQLCAGTHARFNEAAA